MSEWWVAALAVAVGFAAGWSARLLLVRGNAGPAARAPEPAAPAPPQVSGATETPPGDFRVVSNLVRSPSRRPESLGASTAGRIVVHLAALGRLGEDEVARRGHTQAGMAEAIGVGQGGVAKVLARLEAAGVVRQDRRHVSGSPSRLKVYRLTPQGEALARDLRGRGRVPQDPSPVTRDRNVR